MLWPFSSERIGLPWPLFFGVRHSQPYALHLHLVTLVTELLFAAVIWKVSRWCFPPRRFVAPVATSQRIDSSS